MSRLTANIENQFIIKIDTFDLTPAQIRLLKHINTLLVHVISSEEESEYFEISAELMRQTATLIQSSQFVQGQKNKLLAQQAVEYALDFLNEKLNEKDSILRDN